MAEEDDLAVVDEDGLAVVDILARLASIIGDRDGLADVQSMFDELDVDGNGLLDQEEFTLALRKFGIEKWELADDQVSTVFSHIDVDGNGTLDFAEFASGNVSGD
jgi:Ca2+-binding EF-hand superfamily protein